MVFPAWPLTPIPLAPADLQYLSQGLTTQQHINRRSWPPTQRSLCSLPNTDRASLGSMSHRWVSCLDGTGSWDMIVIEVKMIGVGGGGGGGGGGVGGGGGGGGVGGWGWGGEWVIENGKENNVYSCIAELGGSWDQENVMVFMNNHWTPISVLLKSFRLLLPSHLNYTQTVGIYQTWHLCNVQVWERLCGLLFILWKLTSNVLVVA